MPELDGKVAIVTGAGRLRGIGRGAAVAFARLGADVVVTGTGRSPDRYPPDEKAVGWRDIESTAEQVRAEGTRALPLVVDVADADSVQQYGRAHNRRVWQNRHPREQRRLRARSRPRSHYRSSSAYLPAGPGREDYRHLPLREGSRAAHDRAGWRQDSQHIVRLRQDRQREQPRVLRRLLRAGRHDPIPGTMNWGRTTSTLTVSVPVPWTHRAWMMLAGEKRGRQSPTTCPYEERGQTTK